MTPFGNLSTNDVATVGMFISSLSTWIYLFIDRRKLQDKLVERNKEHKLMWGDYKDRHGLRENGGR